MLWRHVRMKMKYFDQLQWASPPRLEAVDQSLSRCSSSVSREQEVTGALRYVEHHLDLHNVHIPALQRSALWRLSGLHWMQLSEGERQGGGDHQVQLGGGDPGQARSSEQENRTHGQIFKHPKFCSLGTILVSVNNTNGCSLFKQALNKIWLHI